jgi:hypothetical protein
MDLDALNRDPILKNTPLGQLRLERYGRGAHAWIGVIRIPHGRFDPNGPGEIIHTLEPGTDVFAAVYGRRFWEQRWVAQAIEARELAEQESDAKAHEAIDADFRAALQPGLEALR